MIGLIFGDTDFPKEILKTIKKKKIRYLIVDLSKSKQFKKEKVSYAVSIGQFGKIINILKENNCKKVLFAGKVNKPNFSKLKLDLKGIYYIPRIIKASKLGDAAILKEIIKILAQNKIKTENSLKFNPELSLKKGNFSKIKPSKQDQLDIKKAIKTLNNLKQYNFSQGVVVRNKKVVSIEGKGGTQNMLEKSYLLAVIIIYDVKVLPKSWLTGGSSSETRFINPSVSAFIEKCRLDKAAFSHLP